MSLLDNLMHACWNKSSIFINFFKNLTVAFMLVQGFSNWSQSGKRWVTEIHPGYS